MGEPVDNTPLIPEQPFPELVRPGVRTAVAEPWMWSTPVYPEEEQLLTRSASEKRRREFRAGRHCAHIVLGQLGHMQGRLLRGKQGEPLWPAGLCGSVSHSGERCVVIGAHKNRFRALAVDIERERPIHDKTWLRISCVGERPVFDSGLPFGLHSSRVILFSIKEAVHKIYYPLNEHTLGFQDVQVAPDAESGTFDAVIHNPSAAICPLEKVTGYFGVRDGYVYSMICLPAEPAISP